MRDLSRVLWIIGAELEARRRDDGRVFGEIELAGKASGPLIPIVGESGSIGPEGYRATIAFELSNN